jgi:hypothetical protein
VPSDCSVRRSKRVLGGRLRLAGVIVVSVRSASSGEMPSAGCRCVSARGSRAAPCAAHEGVVDVGDLGCSGLLVAPDRADEVAVQVRGRDGEPGQPDAGEAVPDAFEGRAARAHDEHALARAHELADRR